MSPDEFQPPVGLSSTFVWIGVGLVALCIASLVLMMYLTRRVGLENAAREPQVYGRTPTTSTDSIYALRQEFHDHISRVELLYLEQRLGDREVHQELSFLIRSFAERRAGEPATVATLEEIRELPISRSLYSLIEYFYTPAFAPQSQGQTVESIEAARKVVSRW